MQHYRTADPYLHRFLEPLEAAVMSVLWSQERATLHDIQRRLAEAHLRTSDVRRALDNLAERGYVKRRTIGRGLARKRCYRPVMTKDQLIDEQTKPRLRGGAAGFIRYTVDSAERPDAVLLRRLEALLMEGEEAEHP